MIVPIMKDPPKTAVPQSPTKTLAVMPLLGEETAPINATVDVAATLTDPDEVYRAATPIAPTNGPVTSLIPPTLIAVVIVRTLHDYSVVCAATPTPPITAPKAVAGSSMVPITAMLPLTLMVTSPSSATAATPMPPTMALERPVTVVTDDDSGSGHEHGDCSCAGVRGNRGTDAADPHG